MKRSTNELHAPWAALRPLLAIRNERGYALSSEELRLLAKAYNV